MSYENSHLEQPVDVLIELYLSGEIEEYFLEWQNSYEGSGMQDYIFYDRNITMAAGIRQRLETELQSGFLFAVGTGHYIGDESVVDLLGQEEYVITRHNLDWPWSLLPDLGGWWRFSGWFGYFNVPEGDTWIYHYNFGWLYSLSSNEDSLWFWFPGLGWRWTMSAAFPFFYDPVKTEWIW